MTAANHSREGVLLRRLFADLSRRRKLQLGLVFALTIAGAAAELVSVGAILPFLQLIAQPEKLAGYPVVADLLETLGLKRPSDLIILAIAMLVVVAVGSSLVRIVLLWATMRYVQGTTHDLSMRVYGRIIRQPYLLAATRNSAEVLAGMEKVNYVGGYLLAPLLQGLSSALMAVALVVLLIVIDPITAIASSLLLGGFYALSGVLIRPVLLRTGRFLTDWSSRRIKLLQETLGGTRDIILDQSHPAFEAQFRYLDVEGRQRAVTQNVSGGLPRILIEAMLIILIGVIGFILSQRPGGIVVALPTLGALAIGAQRLLPMLQNVNVAYLQYAATKGMLSDVFALIDAPILPDLPAGIIEPLTVQRAIELRNLGFGYANGEAALHDVNLTIPAGARIGIIGRTGSGKSTLADVLMGLLPPSSGMIMIDDTPLTPANTRRWQANVAHVPQTIFLSDDSIAANIAFGVPKHVIDLARVRQAAAQADIAAHVETLSNGYMTKVGERGVRLSGGQRQRIGIARALYKQASVLVLDEATSALDDETEAAVTQAIASLDCELTVVLIAHRLSTLQGCDFIVRLEKGRITEIGRYEDVIKQAF
jgi:ABC-type multidrug transport system fused ATPase/permease subunit